MVEPCKWGWGQKAEMVVVLRGPDGRNHWGDVDCRGCIGKQPMPELPVKLADAHGQAEGEAL